MEKYRPWLSVYVTSRCQLRCNSCIVAALRDDYPAYEMTVEECAGLVAATKESGYVCSKMFLTGGEPLLWKNLVPGLVELRKMTKWISVSSNALIARTGAGIDIVRSAIPYINRIRVSRYHGNAAECKRLIDVFGRKISVIDKKRFYIPPTEPIEHSIPAKCNCDRPIVFNGRVYSCGGAMYTSWRLKDSVAPSMVRPVDKGYQDGFYDKRLYQKECRYCCANKKNFSQMKVENN